jgi:FG-GAP-like repeat
LIACRDNRPAPRAAADASVEWFTDATAEAHLDFVHVNGMTGQFYYPEIIAPGAALLDYDNDGDLDVFLVQGGRLAGAVSTGNSEQGGQLFRNDLEIGGDGTRRVRFMNVTDAAGIKATEYGMGAAVGDYDNDGCADLYVTALGRNHLYRNRCDGTFADVTGAGISDDGWSVSAASTSTSQTTVRKINCGSISATAHSRISRSSRARRGATPVRPKLAWVWTRVTSTMTGMRTSS